MAQEPIWPGSGSAVSGNTPFGFYDDDTVFQTDAPKFATWCAKRLGYPITAVEIQDSQLYTCFEESITEYSAQVNQFNIKDNLLSLRGQSTSSNLTHKRLSHTMGEQIFLSETYGSEAQVGGQVETYKNKITLASGSQDYDLNSLVADISGSGAIEVKRVFYESSPAITRYFDPYAGTGQATNNMIDGFGFGGKSPAITFMLQPMYADLLRVQAIEFNDQVRKSAYSFEIVNNKLKLFPIPKASGSLYFQYYKEDDKKAITFDSNLDSISTVAEVPYENPTYSYINSVGRQWIFNYSLALAKEMLAYIRGKYTTVPIPGSETTLNQADLLGDARTEKEALLTDLRETLDASSRGAQLSAKAQEAEDLQTTLKAVPMTIFIG